MTGRFLVCEACGRTMLRLRQFSSSSTSFLKYGMGGTGTNSLPQVYCGGCGHMGLLSLEYSVLSNSSLCLTRAEFRHESRLAEMCSTQTESIVS